MYYPLTPKYESVAIDLHVQRVCRFYFDSLCTAYVTAGGAEVVHTERAQPLGEVPATDSESRAGPTSRGRPPVPGATADGDARPGSHRLHLFVCRHTFSS